LNILCVNYSLYSPYGDDVIIQDGVCWHCHITYTDVTVPDTYADAHVVNTAREAGTAASHAATNKNTNYSQLSKTHVFVPVVIETGVPGTIRR